ncbi:MAG: protein kinase domain-containing protein [Streptosporangiaceae bacterium]
MNGDEHTVTEEHLGPYRLVSRIGEGGMGVVHLALDAAGRTVAVKVLHPHVAYDETSRARLAREVDTMRRVRSPHVAAVLDADIRGERPYIVTRYVPGRSLDEVVRGEGPLAGSALARLARGLADAIASVHAAGIVHRDLKPSNVLLVEGQPVVIDFGVAQAADATRLTRTGLFIGTPAYLAPEVIDGSALQPAADVHAWGATLAFAATGRSPFGEGPHEAIFYNITQDRADLTGVPEPLAGMVRAALARDPDARPPATWLRDRSGGLSSLPGASSGPPGAEEPTRPNTPAVSPLALPGMSALVAAPTARMAPAIPATRPLTQQRPAEERRPVRPQEPAPAESPPRVRDHPVVGLLTLALAIAIGAVAPVAMAIAVIVTAIGLRTSDRLVQGLLMRRWRRGPRASDPWLGVLGLPWHLARGVLVTALLLPIGGGVAGLLGLAATLRGQPPFSAPGAIAGAVFVLVTFLGPGGGTLRRQAGRAIATVLPGRTAAVVAGVIVSLALLFVLSAIGAHVVVWAPWSGPPSLHLPSVGTLWRWLPTSLLPW